MISKEEVLELAELARLKLNDAEVTELQKDISNILEYVETVSTVKIPSGSNVGDGVVALHTVMREDIPHSQDDAIAGKREQLLNALPKREGDFAVVRKIIQKDE